MILLTGYADKENAIKAINEVGLYKYIEKPWDNDELIINIKNAYERSQLIASLQEKNLELERYNNHLEDIVKEKSADIIDMNERLNAVIGNCADGILLVSHSGNVVHANLASETLFGLDLGIIHSKSVFDLFITNDIDWQCVFAKKDK